MLREVLVYVPRQAAMVNLVLRRADDYPPNHWPEIHPDMRMMQVVAKDEEQRPEQVEAERRKYTRLAGIEVQQRSHQHAGRQRHKDPHDRLFERMDARRGERRQ